MQKQEFINISKMNIEELSLFEKIALNKLIDSKNETIIKIFNTQPEHLKKHEIIYITKYLDIANFSLYINNEEVFVAPKNANEITKTEYFVPENAKETPRDEIIQENRFAFEYSNLKKYNISADLKYRLIKHKKMTGYASIDRPWALTGSEKYTIKQDNMLDFFTASRKTFNICDEAFVCYENHTTWDEFTVLVNKIIKSLSMQGLTRGDTMVVATQAITESVAFYFAADYLGITTHFMDPDNTSKENMNKYFNKLNAKLVVTQPAYLDNVNQAKNNTNISKTIVIPPSFSMPNVQNLSNFSKKYMEKANLPFEENENVISISNFISNGEKFNGEIKKCDDNSFISLITSTSGSSGEPKFVNLPRKSIMNELLYIKRSTLINLGPKGVNMQVVPFKYPYGFVISTLLSPFVGKTSGLTPNLTPENSLDFIKMYRPKFIHAIPSFFKNIISKPEAQDMDWSFLEFPVSGGDFYATKAIEEANSFFKAHGSKALIKNGSGMAEDAACMTAQTVGKYNIESVGKPLIGTNVKIIDPVTEEELPYGHIGKICYAGGNQMEGYFGDEIGTQKIKKNVDGVDWLYTDSIGFIDSEGFAYICGRERNFFITYSENGAAYKIYTNNIQDCILRCEGVKDCVVVKMPDDKRDLVPKAYIVLEDGYDPNIVIADVILKCKTDLDSYAIPNQFEITNEIIYTSAHKIDFKLYEEMAKEAYINQNEEKGKNLC